MYHSNYPDRKKALKLVERDLFNGPGHCFGIHDGCSSDFVQLPSNQSAYCSSTLSGSDATVVSENEDMCDADD